MENVFDGDAEYNSQSRYFSMQVLRCYVGMWLSDGQANAECTSDAAAGISSAAQYQKEYYYYLPT